ILLRFRVLSSSEGITFRPSLARISSRKTPDTNPHARSMTSQITNTMLSHRPIQLLWGPSRINRCSSNGLPSLVPETRGGRFEIDVEAHARHGRAERPLGTDANCPGIGDESAHEALGNTNISTRAAKEPVLGRRAPCV